MVDNFIVSSRKEEYGNFSKESLSEDVYKNLSSVMALFCGCNTDGIKKVIERKANHVVKELIVVCEDYKEMSALHKLLTHGIRGRVGWVEDCSGKKTDKPEASWKNLKAFVEYHGEAICVGYVNIGDNYKTWSLLHLSKGNHLMVKFGRRQISESGRVYIPALYSDNEGRSEDSASQPSVTPQQAGMSQKDFLLNDIQNALQRRNEERLSHWQSILHSVIDHFGIACCAEIVPLSQKVTACLDSIKEEKQRKQGDVNYTHIEQQSLNTNIGQLNMGDGRYCK